MELYEEIAEDDEPIEPEDYYLMVGGVTELEPNTRYCYRAESLSAPMTQWASLRTAPKPDERELRFAVLGDSGSGSAAQLAIARRISSWELDAILFVGDIAYPSGSHEQLQSRFFDVYDTIFRRTPVYAAIGNHEWRADRAEPFEDVLVLPGNEHWYSFDWGEVHFVVLDTNLIGREQARWLERDLAPTNLPFRVVLGHHPPVTSAWRGPHEAFVRWFIPVLERHRVELVLCGHEHHYERSRPIRGVTYIVTGGGGARLYRARSRWHTRKSIAAHHYVLLEVEDGAMTVRAIDIADRVIDELVIER